MLNRTVSNHFYPTWSPAHLRSLPAEGCIPDNVGSARFLSQDSQVWPLANDKCAGIDGGQAHWAGCLKQDMQDLLGFSGWRGPCWHSVRSYERMTSDGERLTRDHESLRVLGWLSEAGFAGFTWDFQDGGGHAGTGALVRAYDERLRVFTRDHESLRVLGWLSEAGFAGSTWDFQDGGGPCWHRCARTSVCTRDCECLREITRVYECWAGCLKQDLQDLLGFSGWRGPCWHRCARTSV